MNEIVNQNHSLPFDDASFDIVICSLPIEYITHPLKLFDEVARILRPDNDNHNIPLSDPVYVVWANRE